MSKVSEAVYRAFKPLKLNYELLGNGDPHMHWHIFPRSLSEPNPTHPVWWTSKEEMYSENVKPNNRELDELKHMLLAQLNKII